MILSRAKTKSVVVFGFVPVQFLSCAIDFKVIPNNPLSKKANCFCIWIVMASYRLTAPRGCKGFLGWQGRSLAARSHPSSQPGSWAAPPPGIRFFPGYRLSQDIGPWVGGTRSEVLSQAGAWTVGYGLGEIICQEAERSWEMLGQAVRPAGALWTLTWIGNQSEKQTPTTLGYNCVLKYSSFVKMFILMCSSFSRLKCIVALDKIFCWHYLSEVTWNASCLVWFG